MNRRNRDRILRLVAPIARLQSLLHPQFRLQRLQKQILRRFLRDLQLAARVQLLLPRLLRLPELVELRFLLLQRFVDRHRSLELQIELGRLHLQNELSCFLLYSISILRSNDLLAKFVFDGRLRSARVMP